ncbi:MAG: hypothetical protein OEZ06_00340 [Myxococcales bacterium]|nr:hypothetical protein [Myxococcales bacterium]
MTEPASDTQSPAPQPTKTAEGRVRQHLRAGWIALLIFVTLGTVLEALHAFKSAQYLGVGNEIRRLMWTLAHAHGIGLGLLHIAFAATLQLLGARVEASDRMAMASRLLTVATVLLPGGFFIGGIVTYGGDPGVGVLLVPIGALALWLAILLVGMTTVEREPAADARGQGSSAAHTSSAGDSQS